MAETYSSEILRVVIAQIAQTIGYSNTQSAPLELLEDILLRFIQELARDLHSQAEHANRCEPNLKDVQLSLKNLSTDVHELLDYIGNVEPVPFIREVPEYPIKRNSNLNFLKPGSAETLTRPVHIFEYLPPILSTESSSTSTVIWPNQTEIDQAQNASELSREVSLNCGHKNAEKLRDEVKTDLGDTGIPNWCGQRESPMSLNLLHRDNSDPEGHAVREISSVVMTTGGFISPAIEGKLPEAYVPDIIEKFKGLDEPPKTPPLENLETKITLPNKNVFAEASNLLKVSSVLNSKEQRLLNESNPAGTNIEINNLTEAISPIEPVPIQNKPTKKGKKKHLIGGVRNDQSTEVSKAQEKAHRKALRLFQKMSKTQSESDGTGIISFKKSTKNLNRGMLSLSDKSTERTQLDKLIKKQTKQRQKQLKSQKQSLGSGAGADRFPFAINQSIPLVPATSVVQPLLPPVGCSLVGGNNYTFGSPSLGPSMLNEKKDKFSPEQTISQSAKGIMNSSPSKSIDSFLDEIKLANEPDRNKLNIFKKLSKPKTPKALSPSPISLNSATNLFGNASNGSQLINLPSGTTITPAPTLNIAENAKVSPHKLNVMTSISIPEYTSMQQSIGSVPLCSPNLMVADVHRPKKRGRKPGGKNCVKSPASTEITQKKTKPNKLSPGLSYAPNVSVNPSLVNTLPFPVATEPLNLSHVDQIKVEQLSSGLSGTIGADVEKSVIGEMISFPPVEVSGDKLKCKKVKEKKDRKKVKAKYNQLERDDNKLADNALDLNKKFTFLNADKPIPQTKLAVTSEFSGATERNVQETLSPTNSSPPIIGVHGYLTGLTALPLLPFPPRPGLIPSGLFSPTSLASFAKRGPNKIRSHPFTSTTVGYRPPFIEPTEKKSTAFSVLARPESHLERSYCNVAPLMPESMKLTPIQSDGSKLKSTDPHVGSGSELMIKDDSYSTMLSKYLPNVQGVGVGLLEAANLSVVQCQESTQNKTVQHKASAGTGNLGDPIEVSDDSNDDESNTNSNKKQRSIDGLLHKSSISPPLNIQQFESTHHYPLISDSSPSPISNSKQFKKLKMSVQSLPIKMNQIDSHPLSVVPSSSSMASAVHTSSTPFNINFMGNDKFSLAGGADLIPLSCVDSGLAYSSKTVPLTSLSAGATSESSVQSHALHPNTTVEHNFVSNFVGSGNYDDITIIPTKNLNEVKLHKLHKKPKKPKEGKIKKKKDKKDKTKNKDKNDEKHRLKIDKSKMMDKKQKKEKKKEKLQVPSDMLQLANDNTECITHYNKDIAPSSGLLSVADTVTETVQPTASQTTATASFAQHLTSPKIDLSPNQVPKLTLKFGGKSTPIPYQFEADHDSLITVATSNSTPLTQAQAKRDHSPELARFSPLVTGPPKPKPSESQTLGSSTSAPISVPSIVQTNPNTIANAHNTGLVSSAALNSWMTPTGATGASSESATLSASSVLLPQQLLQSSQSVPKMPLAPFLSTASHSQSQHSALPINAEGSLTLPQSGDSNRPSSYVDAEGYRIWICPACGKVDDGSAMIGCDGCDAWYHWVCVGIFVAPNDKEDWFCRVCSTKKKIHGSDKKKKRNKKK